MECEIRSVFVALDKKLDGSGRYIWRRASEPDVRVRMHPVGEAFPVEVNRDLYLVALGPKDEASLTLSVDLQDNVPFSDDCSPSGSKIPPISKLRATGGGGSPLRFDEVGVHFRATKLKFGDLPSYKRLETSGRVEADLASQS